MKLGLRLITATLLVSMLVPMPGVFASEKAVKKDEILQKFERPEGFRATSIRSARIPSVYDLQKEFDSFKASGNSVDDINQLRWMQNILVVFNKDEAGAEYLFNQIRECGNALQGSTPALTGAGHSQTQQIQQEAENKRGAAQQARAAAVDAELTEEYRAKREVDNHSSVAWRRAQAISEQMKEESPFVKSVRECFTCISLSTAFERQQIAQLEQMLEEIQHDSTAKLLRSDIENYKKQVAGYFEQIERDAAEDKDREAETKVAQHEKETKHRASIGAQASPRTMRALIFGGLFAAVALVIGYMWFKKPAMNQ